MKSLRIFWLSLLSAAMAAAGAFAVEQETVERPRPAGWENIVPGGRFMDRFEPSKPIGALTSDCWGGDNVKPRDVRNGIEDAEFSYWGGNITRVKSQGGRDEYHLFVARWRESEPKGHMFWPNSEIAHAVSDRPDGDFKVVEVLGLGHNPELFRCKDGSWAVYCVDRRRDAYVYRTNDLNAKDWKFERLRLHRNGKDPLDGQSNFSFCARPDGSVLAVCRGGGIWLSEDGIKPFERVSEGSVYPDVAGRFEDPVLWRDEVQYHMIVNDWQGRIAWKLTSPDGFAWTTQPGEAYTINFSKVLDGENVVANDWFKYERMRVFLDEFGRVVQANYAVIDCPKPEDCGGDSHSSKNITIPVNPGRRIESLRRTRNGWEVRIRSERGFDSLKDVDVESLRFGPQSMVAFGAGVKATGTAEAAGDLVAIFPPIELDTPVVEVLGREASGRVLFATARTDGTKLGFFKYENAAAAPAPRSMDEALAPFVASGELSGAISVLVKPGAEETTVAGWADVANKVPMSLDAPFMQCSQTKGFCGVTVAILVEEGKLNLDDPVAKYLPEYAKWPTMTVRMCMNHTAGFDFEIPTKSKHGWAALSLRDTAAEAATRPLKFEPGEGVKYSNTGIDVAAAVVEVVSGKPWDVFLKERVLDPLGMSDSTFWPTDEQLARRIKIYESVANAPSKELAFRKEMPPPYNGQTVHPSAGAGLWTTARDQLKFYRMLMNLGVGDNGVRILKEETVRKLLATSTRGEKFKEGYSLGLNVRGGGWFGHGGAWNTDAAVNPETRQLRLWVVQTIGKPRPWEKQRDAYQEAFFGKAADKNSDAYTGRLD